MTGKEPDKVRIEFINVGEQPDRTIRIAPIIDGIPPSPGRNDPCPCNSGKKYKKCCGRR